MASSRSHFDLLPSGVRRSLARQELRRRGALDQEGEDWAAVLPFCAVDDERDLIDALELAGVRSGSGIDGSRPQPVEWTAEMLVIVRRMLLRAADNMEQAPDGYVEDLTLSKLDRWNRWKDARDAGRQHRVTPAALEACRRLVAEHANG